jgi:hypothetical protein
MSYERTNYSVQGTDKNVKFLFKKIKEKNSEK